MIPKENSTIIALTIGPISRTIGMAESTKEVWAASYVFSYFAKRIIEPFKNNVFLLPMITEEMFDSTHYGAGIFPDRYIFRANEGDFDKLKQRVDHMLEDLADECLKIKRWTGNDGQNKQLICKYLKSYFKVYFFEKFFTESNSRKIVEDCERTLSVLEKQDTFPENVMDGREYLKTLFKNINGFPKYDTNNMICGFNGSFLTKDAYGDDTFGGFKSIIQVSAADLKIDFQKAYFDSLHKSIGKEFSEETDEEAISDAETVLLNDSRVYQYHKYIAIVKADGDSIGKTIEKISDSKYVSEALLQFCREVPRIIADFGGMPIYVGGDDLFFFAPVRNGVKTIFDLVQEIDVYFEQCFKNNVSANDIPLPTLSYGISISYYKHPMFEAIDFSEELLSSAKGHSDGQCKPLKNNIAFAIRKHSGKMLPSFFHKGDSKTYSNFKKLIGEFISVRTSDSSSDEKKFLSSVMHGLRENEELLISLLKDPQRKDLMSNYFTNCFNEPVHLKYQQLFPSIRDFLITATEENKIVFDRIKNRIKSSIPTVKSPEQLSIEMLYTTLRFIHFVTIKGDNNDYENDNI